MKHRTKILWAAIGLAGLGIESTVAQDPQDMQKHLEQLAARDPRIAELLEELAQERETQKYSQAEFVEHASIAWHEYRIAADDTHVLNTGSAGAGTIGSMLGGSVDWVDEPGGERQFLSYMIRSKYDSGKGLGFDFIITPRGGAPVTQEHFFKNFNPITIVVRDLPDGSRYVAQVIPTLQPKKRIREYADHLTIYLESAVLIEDDKYAGEFTVNGEIVGITSGRIGKLFEFGLKQFGSAKPIGRTDGRSIRFEHNGRSYRLYNTVPITTGVPQDTWTVYVNVEDRSIFGFPVSGSGSHSKSYGSYVLGEALKTVQP